LIVSMHVHAHIQLFKYDDMIEKDYLLLV
jgi:hypothetical protein